jgi:type I restriction enzyme S subunit
MPMPPIEEQRRIAAILDKADDLRAKRRAALAQLDTLTQSIFLDMFGGGARPDPAIPFAPLAELLARPLRNGVSPSTAGKVGANVLTLAAITGSRFSGDSVKIAKFASDPSDDRRVNASDFLICRGSGNPDLVGRGQIPTRNMPDVVFPDTMIAARPDTERLLLTYLSESWRQPSVRRQLRAKARTTNGTHKINQESIESVVLPVPDIVKQAEFTRRVQQAQVMEASLRWSSGGADTLLISLQARAFRGEL